MWKNCFRQCWVNSQTDPLSVYKHDILNSIFFLNNLIDFQVQKLQTIIASRASQYNHEMKRKEREFNKLKERLNQLLVDKKEKKQGEILIHPSSYIIVLYLQSYTAIVPFDFQTIYNFLLHSYWCIKPYWESWWKEKPLENWKDRGKVSSILFAFCLVT